MDLSDEQKRAVTAILANIDSEQVQTLGGHAGTGKSFAMTYFAKALPEFAVCAFTGKAADVLKRRDLDAKTIHSTIYRPVDDEDEEDLAPLSIFTPGGAAVAERLKKKKEAAKEKKGRFEPKAPDELGCKGFLIDEASMVSRDLFEDLCGYGLPIIAVGDHGQLPPVGDDAGLMINPDYTLETIHRNAGPIAHFAGHLRTGGKASRWSGSTSGEVMIASRQDVSNDLLLSADEVICGFNRTRVGLNASIRRLKGIKTTGPQTGDRVMCLRNDRFTGVFNGQQGTVGRLFTAQQEMMFHPTYGIPKFVHYHREGWNSDKTPPRNKHDDPGENIPFDFCYAITCHKSQGDQWPTVMVRHERWDEKWEDARWAYTAASRAEKRVIWVS